MPALLRRRGCLVVLGVLLIVTVTAAVLVRMALDPGTLRTLAETRLSEALGQPVTIGRMRLSFLPPSVEGSEIRIGAATGPGGSPGISLRAVRIRPRLSSVFSSPVVIERVEVVGLALDVRRDAEGRWQLPIPALPGREHESGVAAKSVALDVNEIALTDGSVVIANERRAARGGTLRAATIRDITGSVRAAGGEITVDSLTAALGGSSLAGHGSIGPGGMKFSLAWTALSAKDLPEVFSLLGATAPKGLAIEGDKPLTLDLTVDRAGRVAATGRLSASRASLGTLTATAADAPLRYSGQQLVLAPLTFTAYGGTYRGRLTANTAADPVTWTLDGLLERVDVDQLVSSNTSAQGAVDGTGRVQASVRGSAAEPVMRTVHGTVSTHLSNGTLHNFPVLAAINAALKIGAGDEKDLRFDRLSATWQVADARATTSDFLTESGELRLTASGTLGFDLSLDFRGIAAFSKPKSEELVRRVRELAGLRNQQGEIEVPVTVRGSVGAPAFAVDVAALLEKAAQEELKRRIKRAIEGFIKKDG